MENRANYASDLDRLSKFLEQEEKPKQSPNLKRKADQISQNPYEDINAELRELYFLRKQVRQNSDVYPNDESQKIQINLKGEKSKGTENSASKQKETKVTIEEETKMNKENKNILDLVAQLPVPNIATQKQTAPLPVPSKKDPVMWINKLRIYPPDFLLDHMITFRQLMYEDLLKNNPRAINPTPTLQAAFMTTFGYSSGLIEPLLKGGVKLVLADEWSNINEPRIERSYCGVPHFTLIRSPKDPSRKWTGAFHPKIWLLKFPKFLRVVITSGNLTVDDWTTWSNCLWFKDFPKKSTMNKIPEKAPVPEGVFDYDGDFETNLKDFVQSLMPTPTQNYKTLLDINIDDYYISDIDIVLIASIPGRHTDKNFEKYGHQRVSSVLKKIGFVDPARVAQKKHILTYQTSSIGTLDEKFLKEILSSFLPNYRTLDQMKADKKPRGKKALKEAVEDTELASSRVRCVFPTKEYVKNCIEGPEASGCLILNPGMYQKDTFCKDIFYEFHGTEDYAFHEGIIPHLKVWIVADQSGEIDDDSYIYFGSHNFSPSAWGRYEKDYTQMSISNTELGVLVPPKKGSKAKKTEIIKNLPFQFPPQKYSKNQVPWMIQEHFQEAAE